MHPNYEYVLNYIRKNSSQETKSLDYGCGSAEIVIAGRKEGLNIFGADTFDLKHSSRDKVDRSGLLGSVVTEVKQDRMNFPDEHFDLIVNNQVLEHVADLGGVLKEIHLVLKKGGKVLSLFPSKDVWSEGHCGIPFLHRFSKGSRLKVYYAFVWRLFGKGYHKNGKTRIQWSKEFCEWLDKNTFYRSRNENAEVFGKHFEKLEFIEKDYLLFRLERVSPFLYRMFCVISQTPFLGKFLTIFVREKGGLVFTATKS